MHCVKSVRIRSFSGTYFPAFELNMERYSVWMWENMDQKNSKYGHFLHSDDCKSTCCIVQKCDPAAYNITEKKNFEDHCFIFSLCMISLCICLTSKGFHRTSDDGFEVINHIYPSAEWLLVTNLKLSLPSRRNHENDLHWKSKGGPT